METNDKARLTIKELSPYLPYGVKVSTQYINSRFNKPITLNAGVVQSFLRCPDRITVTPYLRPLSDLIQDSDSPERDLIYTIVNDASMHCDAYDEWLESYIDNPEKERILQAPYEVFEELIKNHFDVFGLIDKNLAIDINQLS